MHLPEHIDVTESQLLKRYFESIMSKLISIKYEYCDYAMYTPLVVKSFCNFNVNKKNYKLPAT